ncbi:UNVERIFIED_CONTAM: hypothetical protein Sangu_2715300 [Sesamum angustifolium]|uniref:Retrotransposon gag domain-containing protein n=1 Tax=Sesamum angustifolium TaxID=2727405 RepID=A0AAW2IYL7_9LAMI
MALTLVTTARKLRPYFLSGRSEASGRLVKWAIELSEYDISYLPRTSIKAQALADFVSEMTGTPKKRSLKKNLGYSTWMGPPPHKGVEQA